MCKNQRNGTFRICHTLEHPLPLTIACPFLERFAPSDNVPLHHCGPPRRPLQSRPVNSAAPKKGAKTVTESGCYAARTLLQSRPVNSAAPKKGAKTVTESGCYATRPRVDHVQSRPVNVAGPKLGRQTVTERGYRSLPTNKVPFSRVQLRWPRMWRRWSHGDLD